MVDVKAVINRYTPGLEQAEHGRGIPQDLLFVCAHPRKFLDFSGQI